MAIDCRPVSTRPSHRQAWPSGDRTAPLCRRHLVGTAERGPLEGPAPTLSFVPHLLASLPRVDRRRHLDQSLGQASASARPTGPDRSGRSDCRWNIFLGKKRGDLVGKTKRGKGTKTMVLTDASGLPLSATVASASPHEVTLIEPLLESRVLRRRPGRLIYDAAADSDPLRQRLARRGIELISPHRRNRSKPATQDGRSLRRYRKRWKIERSIGWLQNFRRLVTRYEYYAYLFHGFVQLACLIIVLRQF